MRNIRNFATYQKISNPQKLGQKKEIEGEGKIN